MLVAMRTKGSRASAQAQRRAGGEARLRWTARIAVGVALVAGLAWVTFYEHASGSPGYAAWQDKTSVLLRDAGLGGLLDRFDNLRFKRGAPPDTPPDPRSITLGAGSAAQPAGSDPAYAGLPPLSQTADNAGWHPVIRIPGTAPAVYTAVIQPDPAHRSVVAGVAIVRADATRAHLMAGTALMPGLPSAGRIPPAQLSSVVAAFNSGLNMSARTGGLFVNGATVRTLVNGTASTVIDDQGRVAVGQWGRDMKMTVHVVAVRQNLNLIVDNGKPVAGLNANPDGRWGRPGNQLQYTWRSGLGTTAHGDVVYVAGDKLTLDSLARALAQAGAVRGMELNIGDGAPFFSGWQNDSSGSVRPERLLVTMSGPTDRYIRPEARDFFYFTGIAVR